MTGSIETVRAPRRRLVVEDQMMVLQRLAGMLRTVPGIGVSGPARCVFPEGAGGPSTGRGWSGSGRGPAGYLKVSIAAGCPPSAEGAAGGRGPGKAARFLAARISRTTLSSSRGVLETRWMRATALVEKTLGEFL